ncbi:MAG: hypothetical protein V3R94_01000, partial [Acidobacteriota bacterium]
MVGETTPIIPQFQGMNYSQMVIGAVGVTLVIAIAAVVGVGWYACDNQIHPKRAEESWPVIGEWPRYTPEQFDLPHTEDVHFETSDDLTLSGWFIRGTSRATVILVHGLAANRAEMLPHAGDLHRAGFSVLLYDSRHRGQSEGNDI